MLNPFEFNEGKPLSHKEELSLDEVIKLLLEARIPGRLTTESGYSIMKITDDMFLFNQD